MSTAMLFSLLFLLFFGATAFVFNLGTEAFGGFVANFFEKSLLTGASADSQWPQWWTTFTGELDGVGADIGSFHGTDCLWKNS